MTSIEQDLMVMLRQLPISITITWQNNRYHWQCAGGNGASSNLVEAVKQALQHLMTCFAPDTSRATDNSQAHLAREHGWNMP
jgi:hypothetical protein